MKLGTSIKPRRDGTLSVDALGGGVKYDFAPGPDGDMVGDVKDERTVAHLLNTGNFYPANEKDIPKAQAILAKSAPQQTAAGAQGGEGGAAPAGEVDDDGDDQVDPNALPVEGKAPAAPTK